MILPIVIKQSSVVIFHFVSHKHVVLTLVSDRRNKVEFFADHKSLKNIRSRPF